MYSVIYCFTFGGHFGGQNLQNQKKPLQRT
nr:hypothetical protein CACDSRKY_CACDSRKY_CDS_0052 [Caudoviricetes sp.]